MRKTKYIVKPTTQFKKDFKLAMKRSMKIELLEEVIAMLAMGETLPDKHKAHALTGKYKTYNIHYIKKESRAQNYEDYRYDQVCRSK